MTAPTSSTWPSPSLFSYMFTTIDDDESSGVGGMGVASKYTAVTRSLSPANEINEPGGEVAHL